MAAGSRSTGTSPSRSCPTSCCTCSTTSFTSRTEPLDAMSNLVAFLVVFPLLVGVVLAFVTRGKVRNGLVVGAGAVIALASVATAIAFGNGSAVFFGLPGDLEPGLAVVAAEAVIALFVIVVSLQHGRRLAPLLATAQLAIAVWLEVTGRMPAADPIRLFGFDRLSMVMVLIVGIIGTL